MESAGGESPGAGSPRDRERLAPGPSTRSLAPRGRTSPPAARGPLPRAGGPLIPLSPDRARGTGHGGDGAPRHLPEIARGAGGVPAGGVRAGGVPAVRGDRDRARGSGARRGSGAGVRRPDAISGSGTGASVGGVD